MFVLSNAWRALTRSKGRTALTAFITLAVTFGTVAGLAIIQEDTNAHTTAYDQQKATLAIRPTAATWKKVSATDSASTKHYMDLIHRIRHARPVGHQLVELHGYRNRAGPRER